jgi:hypothetical protein
MSSDNLEEPLQTLTPVLDDIVAEPVGENLSRERGYRDARAFALQDIAEVLEIRVAAAHDGVFKFEGGDVGSAHNLVRRVHVARGAVGLRVTDLLMSLDWVFRYSLCKVDGHRDVGFGWRCMYGV